jgi:hypothetical protein
VKKLVGVALTFAAAGLAALPLQAWDRTGHMVVARIAWEELSPKARAAAYELLQAAPADADLSLPQSEGSLDKGQRQQFQIAAYWPDLMRNGAFPERRDKYHHGDWHWINNFFEQDEDGKARELTDREVPGLVVDRLETLVPMLGDASRPAEERAIHLAWVLHLGGDVHQPLHATARITKTEPQGDRGGNLFALARKSNLHAFWDGILRSSNSRWLRSEDAYVGGIASSIMREHRPEEFGDRIRDRNYGGWARESFEISMAEVYARELERDGKPPGSYRKRAVELGRMRVALAGYRLAALLEETFGDGS